MLLVRKVWEKYSFSCQIRRPTLKLDSVKRMVDTNAFPMTAISTDDVTHDDVFLMKAWESVISVAHSHKERAMRI